MHYSPSQAQGQLVKQRGSHCHSSLLYGTGKVLLYIPLHKRLRDRPKEAADIKSDTLT